MIPDNLPITKVMMLLDEAVVKRLKGGITNQFKFNGGQVREFSFKRGSVDLDKRD
jgi:hypothetical protein